MESTSSIGGSSCRQGPTASGSPYQHTGCGSVWLERVVWDHEAAGSNPVTPIDGDSNRMESLFYCCFCQLCISRRKICDSGIIDK